MGINIYYNKSVRNIMMYAKKFCLRETPRHECNSFM